MNQILNRYFIDFANAVQRMDLAFGTHCNHILIEILLFFLNTKEHVQLTWWCRVLYPHCRFIPLSLKFPNSGSVLFSETSSVFNLET